MKFEHTRCEIIILECYKKKYSNVNFCRTVRQIPFLGKKLGVRPIDPKVGVLRETMYPLLNQS